jgi:hypothetical protein
MTLYARSDVVSVTVPASNGGCGETHIRPVSAGVASKSFVLDCIPCETYLKQDIIANGYRKTRIGNGSKEDLKERWPGLWGHTNTAIPETPGEEESREFGEAEAARNATRVQLEQAASTSQNMSEMTKAIMSNNELMVMLARHFAGDIPTPAETPDPPAVLVHDGYNSRACEDCGTDVIRAEGQRGALSHRCPECKAKRRYNTNAAYETKRRKVA